MEQLYTSKTLWQDFSPTAEPLDVNVMNTCEEGNVVTKNVYFTGRVFDGISRTRVFATVCRPTDKTTKRAVLVVNDYKKPIDSAVLKDLAKRGFIAVAIDFAGRCKKGLHTLYPEIIDYCNADVAPDMFTIIKTARETKFYEYALNCMRAITYLIEAEKATKISLMTVAKGVRVGMIVMGADKRLCNGAVLFGGLRTKYPMENADSDILTDKDELNEHLEESDKSQKWMLALSPQAYASQIDIPLYVVNSANSMYVDVLESNAMYNRINDNSRMLILPLSIDFLPADYSQSVISWMQGSKIPKEVELSSFYDKNGDYNLKLKTDKDPSQVSIWYCANSGTRAKYWMKANVTQGDNFLFAKLDMYENNCDLLAFAVLEGETAISTPIFEENVKVNNVKPPNNILFSGAGSQNLISVSYKEWWNADTQGKLAKGFLNIVGMKGRALATFALNDKSVRRSLSLMCSFDICCSAKQVLNVTAVCNFGKTNDHYRQQVELLGDGKWQRVIIEGAKFRRVDDGKSLLEKDLVDLLIIHADDEFIINNICLL